MGAKLRAIFLPILITLLLIEIVCHFVLAKNLLLQDMPTYSLKNARSNFWVETNPDFGIWHAPNADYLHRRACFEVENHSNSFGMRDKERALVSDKSRVVVLGDSFVEGYGISEGKRITDLLEKGRGIEHLNFGTAGSFGPAQYYLLYKTLAKKFSHDEVIIALYPKNDFSDDDYEIWKDTGRYRPFFVGEYPNYRLIYSAKQPQGDAPSLGRSVRGLLREFTNTYNVYTYLKSLILYGSKEVQSRRNGSAYSGFYDFTDEGWNRMRYALEEIFEEAAGKKITVVLIPGPQDIERYGKESGPTPLAKNIAALGQAHGVNVVDLLPAFGQSGTDWKKYYNYPCDRHLSEFGSALAAQVLLSHFSRAESQPAEKPSGAEGSGSLR
ncbi:MAG: hypothetical protein K8R69_05325 [Deltaproteobacteria bacterium]|nr:hypothetical protein [Deltaproteobacteria bacterium]